MVVVDASVIVAALLGHPVAREVLDREEVHVPSHTDLEVLSALRRLVLTGSETAPTAVDALRGWRRLGARRHAVVGSLGRIWRLRENLTSYDAAYVALAERLQCDLVTADRAFANAPEVRCRVTMLR